MSTLKDLCRVCAKNSARMVDLFSKRSKGLTLAEMFVICTKNVVADNDERPTNICSSCSRDLELVYKFHNLVKSSEEYFMQTLLEIQFKPVVEVEEDIVLLLLKREPQEEEEEGEEIQREEERVLLTPEEEITDVPIDEMKAIPHSPTSRLPKKLKKTFECFRCRWGTRSLKRLRSHMHKHRRGTPYKCEVCPMFFSAESLQRHLCRGTRVQCEYCPESFDNTLTLMKHLNCHQQNYKLQKCSECTKVFPMMFLLEIHKLKHNNLEKPFVCHVCNGRFPHQSVLNYHIKIHTEERPHLCAECGMGFKTATSLRYHVVRHSDVRPIACPQCPKRFYDKGALGKHMDVHSDAKYICNICGSTLGSRRSRDEHKRLRHRNIEEPTCGVCSLKCKTLSGLRRHLLIHTGEKPHKCEYCDRAFAHKGDLNKHLRCHIGENTYRCEICGESFRLKNELQKHSYQHFQESKNGESLEF